MFRRNPILTTNYPRVPTVFTDKKNAEFASVSIQYSNNSVNNSTISYFPTNNIMTMDISQNLIDEVSFQVVKKFSSTKFIITNYFPEQPLITNFSCLYFLKLNEIYQNYTNITNLSLAPYQPINSIYSCFSDPTGNKSFANYYFTNDTDMSHQPPIKRRVNIPLFYGRRWKSFRYIQPDYYTQILQNSDFFLELNSFLYIFKNVDLFEYYSYILFIKLRASFFMVLYLNLTIWYLTIICIAVILVYVTSSLTTPINKLIKLVASIGKENSDPNDESKEDMKNIKFPDDMDIDELFQICINLINGGFSDNEEKLNTFKFLSSAYNNISFVKLNNIIIDDEKIEKNSSECSKGIFQYKSLDPMLKQDENILFNSFSQDVINNPTDNILKERRPSRNFLSPILPEKLDKLGTLTYKETINYSNHQDINSNVNNEITGFDKKKELSDEHIIDLIVRDFNKKTERKSSLSKIYSKMDFK